MKKIKQFFIKYWIFIFLSIILSFLFSFYLINKTIAPENKENLLSIPIQKFKIYPLKIPLNLSNFNEKLPDLKEKPLVYQIKNFSFSDQDAISIAKNFNFNEQPQVSKNQNNNIFYEWSNEEKYLSINLTLGKIIFQINNLPIKATAQNKLPSFKEAQQEAENFIKKNNFSPPENIDLKFKNGYYLQNSENDFIETSSLKNDGFVKIEFNYEINSSIILGPQVNFILGENNEILSFNYEPSFKEISKLAFYPIKNQNEFKNSLKEVKSINFFDIPGSFTIGNESEDIKDINFNQIKLIYLKDDLQQSYLQPLFFITGGAVLKDGTQAEVGVYLPAIKDKYLLK